MSKKGQVKLNTEGVPGSNGSEQALFTQWQERYADTGIPQLLVAAGTAPSEMRLDGCDNLTHSHGVGAIMAEYTPVRMVPALQTAVIGHDTILPREGRLEKHDEMALGMRFGPLSHQIMEKIHAVYKDPSLDPNERKTKAGELLYAMGVAVSSNMWEFAGERWREMTMSYFDEDPEVVKDMGFVAEDLEMISKKHGISVLELREGIFNALSSGKAPVSEAMREFRIPMIDMNQVLYDFGRKYDLEGLVIKASEMIFNCSPEHRNPQRPAAAWRDAQELYSFYAPLLEFLGFDELSALAYGTANEYFYENSPHMAQARDVQARASFLWQSGLNKSVLSAMHAIPGTVVLHERIKHVGSIVDKIEGGRGTPDIIGLRAQIPEAASPQTTEKHIWTYVDRVRKQMAGQGFILGDIRGNNPIEIKWEGMGQTSGKKRRADKERVGYTIEGPTVDGYEGIHLCFYHQDDPEIGLEVQMFTPRQDKIRTGIAAHGFYKAKRAVGELGRTRREYDRALKDGATGLEAQVARRDYFHQRAQLLNLLRQFQKRIPRFAGSEDEFKYWLSNGAPNILYENFPDVLTDMEDLLLEVCPSFLNTDEENESAWYFEV